MQIGPTDYLQHHLGPISRAIDSFGGPHVLMGCIASGGQPHIYILNNLNPGMRKEMFQALAAKLNEMADEASTSNIVTMPTSSIIRP